LLSHRIWFETGDVSTPSPQREPMASTNPFRDLYAGGPNRDKQDSQKVTYNSDFTAKVYIDSQESFASNEVCINWNAPAV
jgi:hypothetical protein